MKPAVIAAGILACLQISMCVADDATTATATQARTGPTATSGAASTTAPLSAQTPGTTVTLPSGLMYIDQVIGTGPYPGGEQTVTIHYVGRLENGRIFDSSRHRMLPVPFKFELGQGAVVGGMEEGIKTMRVGGRRLLIIPPVLGYGSKGNARVPPDATLFYDVELLGTN